MSGSGGDTLNAGKFLRNKATQIAYILSFNNYPQVAPARHKPYALHFRKAIDPFGNSVKADIAGRNDLYINESEYLFNPCPFPIDYRLVSFDDSALFKVGNLPLHLAFAHTRQRGYTCNRCSSVLGEDTKYFV